MRRRRKSAAMRGPTLGICSKRTTDSLLFARRLVAMAPRASERREADDVAAGLANVELRRSVKCLVPLLDDRRAPHRAFDLVEITDRRHGDEQCRAVALEIARLAGSLGDH